MDWCAFFTTLAADVIAGLAVLAAAYFFVENRLSLRAERSRREDEERGREEMRKSILQTVHDELISAAGQLQLWLKELPAGGIPYPGFDMNGWTLVSQVPVMTTLSRETIQALTQVYNRMRSANEQLAFLSDLNHGSTAIAVTAQRGASKEPLAEEAYERFVAFRDQVLDLLIERAENLKGHIDTAIDRVEAELGMEVERPSALRNYIPRQT